MAKVIKLTPRTKQLEKMSLAELLEQCRDEKELAKVVCRRLKKLKEKGNKLHDKAFWFAFPFMLVGLCSLMWLLKFFNQISATIASGLVGLTTLCVYATYSIFRKYGSELSVIREERKELYKVAMLLWLKERTAGERRSFDEFVEENAR